MINQWMPVSALFNFGHLHHIGQVTQFEGHGTCVYDDIASCYLAIIFKDLDDILNRFIGGSESVVVVTAHSPNEVEGGQHVHFVRKNDDFNVLFGAITGHFEGSVSRTGHT
jgi:hypothetical protein